MSEMLGYVVDLAKKNSDALSFIPTPRLEEYERNGQILVSQENDEPCGFLIYGNGKDTMRVYQACIQYDSRRREHGLALVKRLVNAATRRGCHTISLWCADDLESNEFWRASGFVFSGQRIGGQTRGRRHNHWVMTIAGLWDGSDWAGTETHGLVAPPTIDKAPRKYRRGRAA